MYCILEYLSVRRASLTLSSFPADIQQRSLDLIRDPMLRAVLLRGGREGSRGSELALDGGLHRECGESEEQTPIGCDVL